MLVVLHAADGAGNASAVNLVAEDGFLPCGGKAGLDVAGLNGAYAYSERAKLVRQSHGVGIHRGFCGAVINLKGNGYGCGNAAYVYDFSAALFPHNRDNELIKAHHTEKVRVEQALRLLGVGELRRSGYAEAGIVYHKVNAPLGGENLLHRGDNAGLVGDVGGYVIYPLNAFFPAAQFINCPAVAFKGKDGGFSYAGGSARYYCNFVHKKILAL